MPAGRLYYRYAVMRDMASEVGDGRDPIAKIIRIENLLEADRDSFQVAAGQPAVGGKAFSQDQQIGLLRGEPIVVGAEHTTDVGKRVLFRREGASVSQRKHSSGNLSRR